jgi:hypothetical protein
VLQALALWSLLFRDGSFKQVPNAEIAHVAERHRRTELALFAFSLISLI